MNNLLAVGVDPGVATGFFFLHTITDRSRAIQCDAVTAPVMLETMLARYSPAGVVCGIEEFRKGTRRLRGHYGAVTRDLVTVLSNIAHAQHMNVVVRPAATVKPWATDERLEHAGLTALTGHGMVHARDAARHALYAAVSAELLPDPLSRRPLKTVMHDE